MLTGWARSIQISPPQLSGDRFPWYWTYAIFLERRWEQISEISGLYGDPDAPGDDREIPKEYWHDQKRVDAWIERMKEKRREMSENPK